MLNTFSITGNPTAEPKQRYDNRGNPYIEFRLASRRDYFSPSQPFDFISFRAQKSNMENILKYVQVGQCITVRGSIHSGLRTVGDKQYPVEYKDVEKVYFDKQKDPPQNPDPKQQEILEFTARYDGFDEDGPFPEEGGD